MSDKLTETDREHVISLFTSWGMCPDCIAELREFLKTARKDESAIAWAELLCFECEGIYYEMIPKAREAARKMGDKDV